MTISGIKFNDPSLTQKFDLNNDGKVSIKELKKIAENDGNKNDLSAKDLESIGVTDTSIQSQVIELYNKSHSSSPNSISFGPPNNKNSENNAVDTNSTVTDDGNDYWGHDLYDKHKNDAQDPIFDPEKKIKEGANKFNKNDLLEKSGGDENVKELLKYIGNDNTSGHYISKLFDDHPDKAKELCKQLLDYTKKESSSSSLIDPKQKKEFVKDLLHDIAYPTDINQQQEGTCTSTSVQVKLAKEDPQKYLDIATTLADGQNWQNIKPNPNVDLEDKKEDKRTLSAKIVQNAFMDFGNGAKLDWGSKDIAAEENKNRSESDQMEYKGIDRNELATLEKEVFGEKFKPLVKTDKNIDQIFKDIDESLTNKESVPFSSVGIDPKDNEQKAHQMLILSKNSDGSYQIFTWGQEINVSAEDLKKHLYDAQISSEYL
jgi:hypothetical protein